MLNVSIAGKFQTRMIVHALKNGINWVRGTSDLNHTLMATAATGAVSSLIPGLSATNATFVNLGSVSAMVGTQLWVALVGGPTMFSNMERTKFGDIQARLFPKMGMACMSMSGLGIASYLHSHSPDTALYLLATSFLINAVNSFIVFPICTGYMYERRKHEEGSEEQKKASMMFGITHGVSNLINLGSIIANLAYLYILAERVTKAW